MRLETRDDFERARTRLRGRDADSLAAFLLSLAQDLGPVGAQVRTFIVGDDLAETVASVQARISGLESPSDYAHRHARGQDIGVSVDFIVDSVERLVLPIDPKAAFQLLAALFEVDGVAMEQCGEHDWAVSCAYQRAVGVLAEAAKSLPRAEVEGPLHALIDRDGYGMRAGLASVLSAGPK